MQAMAVMITAVVPVVAVLLLGRVLAKGGLLSPTGAMELNRLVYWVGLPAQLLLSVANADLRQAFDGPALAAAGLSFVIVLGLTLLLSHRRSPAERGSLVSGAARANAAYIGLPIIILVAQALPAETGVHLVPTYTVILAFMVPLFNIGSVLGFVLPQHGVNAGGMRQTLRALPRNPLILACVAGMALSWWAPGILYHNANVVATSIQLVAQAALPLALLVTGAALDVTKLRASTGLLLCTASGKLILAPAVTAALAWAFGATPTGIITATILMACPSAVASVPMSRQLGGDESLMAAQVVLTTLLAPITLILWMTFLLAQ